MPYHLAVYHQHKYSLTLLFYLCVYLNRKYSIYLGIDSKQHVHVAHFFKTKGKAKHIIRACPAVNVLNGSYSMSADIRPGWREFVPVYIQDQKVEQVYTISSCLKWTTPSPSSKKAHQRLFFMRQTKTFRSLRGDASVLSGCDWIPYLLYSSMGTTAKEKKQLDKIVCTTHNAQFPLLFRFCFS